MIRQTIYTLTALAIGSAMHPGNAQPVNPFDHQKKNALKIQQAPDLPVQQVVRYQPSEDAVIRRSAIVRKAFVPTSSFGSKASIFETDAAAKSYLAVCAEELGLTSAETKFELVSVKADALQGTHIRMKQVYQGIPVYGGEIILHASAQQFELINGTLIHDPFPASLQPAATMMEAQLAAANHLRQHTQVRNLSKEEQALLNYYEPESELILYNRPDLSVKNRLTWHLVVRPNLLEKWDCFVDAQTGKVIHAANTTCAADGPKTAIASDINNISRTIHTYLKDSTYYLIDATKSMFNPSSPIPARPEGAIWTLDALNTEALSISQISNTDNNSWSAKAVSAHFNAGSVFDYFKNTHSHNAIDNQGSSIVSIINVTLPGGSPLDNVFWNGQAIIYGNGNTKFRPLVGSLDLAGHEFTHGVIQSLSNLEYYGQSGAINESIADVFGCMMDKGDWNIGEDVVKASAFPSGALRNMQEPHNGTTQGNPGWQPNHMSEYFIGSSDNGGVHLNSGILNKAFYLMANSISLTKAEKIYYRALSTYLTRYSQFYDFRFAVVQAASDLYGGTASTEANAARSAFDQVGIFDNGEGLQYALDLQPGTGTNDRLLVYDPNYFNINRLNLTNLDGTSPVPLSITPSIQNPSVPDNGSFCVFVDTNGRIRRIELVGPPNETVLFPGETHFRNVAVSKDGSRLAAVRKAADTSIYVYTFQSNTWTQFKIYHQTYVENTKSPGLQVVDALEWDHTGQYIIFDARYTVGDSLTYWDIGSIHVWNNQTNSVGTGRTEKLVSELPNAISIGNPRFSRNSPYIIAFDMFNRIDSTFVIMAKNLITGASGQIATNNMLGNPSFSRLDDKLLYSTFDPSTLDTAIFSIELGSNKIEPFGAPTLLVTHSKWINWLAFGDRQLIPGNKNLLKFQLTSLNPKVNGIIIGDSVLLKVPESSILTNQTADFVTSPFCVVDVGTTRQYSGLSKNNFTAPVVYKITAPNNSQKNYTVIAQKPSQSKEITSFSFQDLNPIVVGTFSNDTITLRVPATTDVTDLRAFFTASAFAKVTVNGVLQQSGITVNDFFDPVPYQVTAYDSTTRTYIVVVKSSTAVSEVEGSQLISLYPNPAKDKVRFDLKGFVRFSIIDLTGKEMQSGTTDKSELNIAHLTDGAYFIRLEQDGMLYSGKLFKLN